MNKETFLARGNATSVQTKEVDLPGGGDKIKIRKLSQAEVEHIAKHYNGTDKAAGTNRYIVTKAALNDDGTQMFDEKDIDTLKALPFEDVTAVAAAAGQFSGMGDDLKNG